MTDRSASVVVRQALAAYRMDPGLALHRAAEALLVRAAHPTVPALDLGSHDGVFATLAWEPERRARLIGCDVDMAALRRATPHYRACVAAEAARLPFRACAFDTVLCNSVLTHVGDLDGALGEIRRVLRTGGRLIVTVPTPRFHALLAPCRAAAALGLHGAARRLAARYDRACGQRHFLDRAQWGERLGAAGLRLETWTEYLGRRGALVWSTLLIGVRVGAGRFTVGAAARRLLPAHSRRAALVEAALTRALVSQTQPSDEGGSAVFVARRAA